MRDEHALNCVPSQVRPEQTPADIDMDDGDQLDCMLEQQGGVVFVEVF